MSHSNSEAAADIHRSDRRSNRLPISCAFHKSCLNRKASRLLYFVKESQHKLHVQFATIMVEEVKHTLKEVLYLDETKVEFPIMKNSVWQKT